MISPFVFSQKQRIVEKRGNSRIIIGFYIDQSDWSI